MCPANSCCKKSDQSVSTLKQDSPNWQRYLEEPVDHVHQLQQLWVVPAQPLPADDPPERVHHGDVEQVAHVRGAAGVVLQGCVREVVGSDN